MGHQIRFYVCDEMRAALESEARRIGAKLARKYEPDHSVTQFVDDMGEREGRLWTEAPDLTHYQTLCRAIKTGAVYDRETALWVKRTSLEAWSECRAAKK